MGGIEEKVYIKVAKEIIKATPEADVDRTSSDGKASSVQFLHFNFSNEQIKKFKDLNNEVTITIDHPVYNHTVKIPKDIKVELIKDFN